MSSCLVLQRLLLLLLVVLLTTTITVDAFSSTPQQQQQQLLQLLHSRSSCSSRYNLQLNLFGRKSRVEPTKDDENGSDSDSDSGKRGGGILKNKVKRLNWLSTSSRGKRNNKKYKSTPEDRHAWKQKKNNAPGYAVYADGRQFSAFLEPIVYRWRGLRQKLRQIIYRNTVYVLQCEDDNYYVGSTRNRKQRYRQHFENPRGGSKWTRLHKPIKVIAEYKRIPSRYLMGVESQKTAEYMMKYGVNNVRGASFCYSRKFTTDDIPGLTGFLGHYNQLDYQELYTELRKVLPKPPPIPSSSSSSFPFDRKDRWSNKNPNTATTTNNSSNSSRNSYDNDDISEQAVSRRKTRNYNRKLRKKNRAVNKDRDLCYKCGQTGHWASECPNDTNDNRTFKNRMESTSTASSRTSTSSSSSFEDTLDSLFESDSEPEPEPESDSSSASVSASASKPSESASTISDRDDNEIDGEEHLSA